MAKDYYQILGIDKTAGAEEIKRAFHKLAHKYHPDKKGGDEKKFKEINEAYQTLSDKKRRAEYDAYGQAFGGAGGPSGGFSAEGAGGFGGFDFSAFDLNDIFSEFFSGGRQGGRRVKRGRDVSVDIQIPFAEAVFGGERKILINKISVCDRCQGSGGEPGTTLKACEVCGGQGQIHENKQSFFGSFTAVRECTRCFGRGQIPEKPCAACRGYGVLKRGEEITVVIPAGIADGEMIRLAGQGEAAAGGMAGDLYVKVYVEKHTIFSREGHNLTMNLDVKLTDSLLGAEYKINALDSEIKLKIPAGISSGEILRLRGRGVPIKGDRRGDLMIKIVVKNPNHLSTKAKKLIEELKEEGI